MEKNNLNRPYNLVMIGGSAGSLEVILKTLPRLKDETELSIVIVLHRKSSIDSPLTYLLAGKTSWEVQEVEEKQQIRPRTIYIAPADYHLLIEADHSFSLDFSEKIHYSRPSIDVSFECAAEIYGPSLVCVLLSGANEDGAEGLKKAKAAGALIIIQDPETADVSYMPKFAMNNVEADMIIKPEDLGEIINQLGR